MAENSDDNPNSIYTQMENRPAIPKFLSFQAMKINSATDIMKSEPFYG